MKYKNKLFLGFVFISFLALIYRSWFIVPEIIGGDWPYYFKEFLEEFSFFPPSWAAYQGNGLGGQGISYPLDSYLYFIVSLFVNTLHLPWEIVYKLFFFGLFIILSIYSSINLTTLVLPRAKNWQKFLSSLIFTTNTYILMVVGGGQMGVALAYSVAPLVLARFLMIVQSSSIRQAQDKVQSSLVAGLVLAMQIMFDARIAYITMIAVAIYAVLSIRYYVLSVKTLRKKILSTLYFLLYTFAIPIGITILLHASWVLPFIVFRSTPAQAIITGQASVESFRFFSFAPFSQSFSLLHPNWPENIFGKIYFMRPEFLILPILAYSSLLFISKIKYQRSKIQIKNQKFDNNLTMEQFNNRAIIFFALLGLLGAFLAKGINPPFGEINIWLFQYFPGMTMFRDPTKFYLLTALSYAVLIPFSLWRIYEWLRGKKKFSIFSPRGEAGNFQFSIKNKIFNFQNLFLILTTLYLILLISPALFGQLEGTFTKREIPKEYIDLKNFLASQPAFFRTLWIPRQQRFTYYSNTHPSVEAVPLFKATNSAQIVSRLRGSESHRLLEELAIKYIIVPYDPFGEIFVKDRKYDREQYQETVDYLNSITWLKRIDGFGKVIVFQTPLAYDHFWLASKGNVSFKMLTPSHYRTTISVESPTKLLFSETYNPYWIMKKGDKIVYAERSDDNTNRFSLKEPGTYTVEIFFSKEKFYYLGRIISIAALIAICAFLIVARVRDYEKSRKNIM